MKAKIVLLVLVIMLISVTLTPSAEARLAKRQFPGAKIVETPIFKTTYYARAKRQFPGAKYVIDSSPFKLSNKVKRQFPGLKKPSP